MMKYIVIAGALGFALGPVQAEETQPIAEQVLQPQYVRPLFAQRESGKNDSNPAWLHGGSMLSIERSEEAKREIVITRVNGTVVKNVYYQTDEGDLGLGALLPGLGKLTSFNSGLSWSSAGDKFVFMSNAGEGNYDLYLGSMESKTVSRLTQAPQKDGQSDWSPVGATIAYVSGTDGEAQIFLMDVASQHAEQITSGKRSCLYPRWSPDGKRIAATCGLTENHDIVVLDHLPDVKPPPPPPPPSAKEAAAGVSAPVAASAVQAAPPKHPVVEQSLTVWRYDDLSPAWSPDGKRVAFYSNYNEEGDPKVWCLIVVDIDSSTPIESEQLVARVVAMNVLPDVAQGPAWLPDSKHIAYVRNDKRDYSPIYVVDVETHNEVRLETGTSINHDLAVSTDGILAFRAQVDQWDQIFLVKFPEGTQ